jgi:hypothetical protein
MDQFYNPSSVAPFQAGYMLLVGMGTGKDGYNGLKFEYGEVPGPGQVPKFSDYNFIDSTNPKAKPTSTVTQNGNYKGCIPYLFALDDQTLQVIYYGEENGQEGVFGHTFVFDGTNLNRVATAQLLVSVSKTEGGIFQFGASTVPGMPGVIVATPSSGSIGVNLTWCAPPSDPQSQTYNLDTQLLTSQPLSLDSAAFLLSLAIVVNTTGFSDAPFFGILLVGTIGQTAPVFLLNAFPIEMSNGVPTAISGFSANSATIYESCLGLFRGCDGTAYAQAEMNGGMGITQIGFGLQAQTLLCSDWLEVANSKDANQMAPVFYTFGAFNPNPNIGDTETVAVYRSIAWNSSHFQTDQVGNAKRTVFQETTDPENSQGIVIGIIDSGPPTPNENVVSLPVDTQTGTTTFGVTTAESTGWTMSSSLGAVFEIKATAGIPKVFSASNTMKLSLGVTGGGSQQTQSTEIQAFSSQASTVAGQNGSVTSTQGVAMVYYPTYTCYQFDFLDATGSPIAGAAPYFELYPTGWVNRTLPFDYDPNAKSGIIPGELMSYVVDPATLSALKSEMLNSTGTVEFAWSTAGTESLQNSLLESGTKNIGTYLDFEDSISGTFGDEVSSVSVSAGVQVKFNFNYTWTQSTTDQISTQIASVLSAATGQNPGAYGNYTYDVYLLAHDNAYTQDLIELLQSYPTPTNQAVLKVIAPGSVPWKMMHVLRAWEQAPASGSESTEAMAEFLKRYPGWRPRTLKTTRPKALRTGTGPA